MSIKEWIKYLVIFNAGFYLSVLLLMTIEHFTGLKNMHAFIQIMVNSLFGSLFVAYFYNKDHKEGPDKRLREKFALYATLSNVFLGLLLLFGIMPFFGISGFIILETFLGGMEGSALLLTGVMTLIALLIQYFTIKSNFKKFEKSEKEVSSVAKILISLVFIILIGLMAYAVINNSSHTDGVQTVARSGGDVNALYMKYMEQNKQDIGLYAGLYMCGNADLAKTNVVGVQEIKDFLKQNEVPDDELGSNAIAIRATILQYFKWYAASFAAHYTKRQGIEPSSFDKNKFCEEFVQEYKVLYTS